MSRSTVTFGMVIALSIPLFAQAGPKDDFEKAYSQAERTHQEAGTFQWTTTSDRLKAAQEAAGAGDYDAAARLARDALELAQQSVAQQQDQKEAWRITAIGD
ncbi:hypothetical protein QQF73_09980 [Marinobacter sp. M216]|uniref:SoxXA-binding protein n=1 Tax=Marinobacter albus TaxID=3030833 RepID=A0ABT7HC45_9GAMM|nr:MULTISPECIES: hypothetical protein [unclassified Marinobacter]MBW7469790.1 hypothetical protein [Marinobacter sp. F4218]MDK9557951.1 hypothetical protein [Marinobacter sp. M216]